MLRVGFIGCGNHATQNLYPSLVLNDVELVAVADLHETNRERNRRRFGAARAYDNYKALLASEAELDAVCISGPPALHFEAAMAAVDRGLHVYVEKPPAPSAAEARQLADAARAAGVTHMCGFMKRFAPRYRQARDIAAGWDESSPRHLLVRYSHGAAGPRERTLSTMTIHAIDLVRFFLGDPTSAQVTWSGTAEKCGMFAVNLRFPTGHTATLLSQANFPGVMERIEFAGAGEAIFVEELASLRHIVTGDGVWAPPVATLYESNFPLQVQANHTLHLQGYAGEMAAFVEAASKGQPVPEASFDDGAAAMELADVLATDDENAIDLGIRP